MPRNFMPPEGEQPEGQVNDNDEVEYQNGEKHCADCGCERCAQCRDAQAQGGEPMPEDMQGGTEKMPSKKPSLDVVIAMGEKKMEDAKAKAARKYGKGVVRGIAHK